MQKFPLAEDIYWIGAIDWDMRNRYYANILMPLGNQVQKTLQKVGERVLESLGYPHQLARLVNEIRRMDLLAQLQSVLLSQNSTEVHYPV